jgi:hypothetical protein
VGKNCQQEAGDLMSFFLEGAEMSEKSLELSWRPMARNLQEWD